MSRSTEEQNTIEDLFAALDEAVDSCALAWTPEKARLILEITARLREFEVNLSPKAVKPEHQVNFMNFHENADRPFSPLRDPIFSVVCDPLTGRRGSVVNIYEGAPECLEYDVVWFDTRAISKSPRVYLVKRELLDKLWFER